MKKPLVTVAIPTYKRPKLLRRALDRLLEQDYENFEVLISDNATEGDVVEKIILQYKDSSLNITFYKQKENIGAFKNFFFLLGRAKGDYFMWLADDDEISLGYISNLSEMLTKNPDAATVYANWFLKRDRNSGVMMPRKDYGENFWLFRAIKFILNGSDDFFYGMHRRSFLVKARFNGYWWPNNKQLINWAYVFLLDQVLAGKVLVTTNEKIIFINHDYGVKNYSLTNQSILSLLYRMLRRLNIYSLYFIKIAQQKSLFFLIPILLALIFSALAEMLIFLKRNLVDRLLNFVVLLKNKVEI
jgi:glycosyltransferase involved in cell wall biosynthesis